MDNLPMQTRVILAALLSFGFFILFDTYYVQDLRKEQKLAQNKKQLESKITKQNQAPVVSSNINNNQAPNQAPSLENISSNDINLAPISGNDKNIIATIVSKKFDIFLDNKGRISNIKLKGKKFGENGLYLFSKNTVKPLELRFSNKSINQEAFNTAYTTKSKIYDLYENVSVILEQKLKNINITKTLTFYANGSYKVHIATSKNVEMFMTLGYKPDADIDAFVFSGAIIKELDGTLSLYEDGDIVSNTNFKDVSIVASADKYYTNLFYDFDNKLSGVVSQYKYEDDEEESLVFIRVINNQSINGYIGEKNYAKLKAIDPLLVDIIEYGFITFFAKPLFAFLSYINSYVDNWGWSIVILTIIIKILVFPLTYKGMMSMGRLKELTPQIKEIQAKHKGDPGKSGTAMMALYKKHDASPMGGCLPILLQMPVFFAIYRVLLNAVELKGAYWTLWIDDLSIHDPYFVLPILMGGSMFVQQLITPTTITDPTQQKIFKFLPVIFTIFFLTFPAGLVLYWIVNNVLSIAQQYYINKKLEHVRIQRDLHKKEAHKKEMQEKDAQKESKKK